MRLFSKNTVKKRSVRSPAVRSPLFHVAGTAERLVDSYGSAELIPSLLPPSLTLGAISGIETSFRTRLISGEHQRGWRRKDTGRDTLSKHEKSTSWSCAQQKCKQICFGFSGWLWYALVLAPHQWVTALTGHFKQMSKSFLFWIKRKNYLLCQTSSDWQASATERSKCKLLARSTLANLPFKTTYGPFQI